MITVRINKKFLRRLKILSSIIVYTGLCLLMIVGVLNAQRGGVPSQLRGGEGANVAFPPTTTFSQAIQILSQISRDVEGKVIIDPTNQQGPINVSVATLNWKRALKMILMANGLEFVERATHYEIRLFGAVVDLS